MEGFHKRLNYLIEESSLSKAELARKIDISLPTLYTYINGRSTPSLETISKIAAAFDVSVDWLVGASDQRKRNLFEIDFTDPKAVSSILSELASKIESDGLPRKHVDLKDVFQRDQVRWGDRVLTDEEIRYAVGAIKGILGM